MYGSATLVTFTCCPALRESGTSISNGFRGAFCIWYLGSVVLHAQTPNSLPYKHQLERVGDGVRSGVERYEAVGPRKPLHVRIEVAGQVFQPALCH